MSSISQTVFATGCLVLATIVAAVGLYRDRR